jgi:hypothetical protein
MIGMWIILWHGFRLMGQIMSPNPASAPAGVAEPGPS